MWQYWIIRRCWKRKRRSRMINVYERAKKLYPDPWNKAMLKRLVRNGSLTEEEYKDITGEDYDG